jgi:CubicO group peptidase (beta-lactamase class C family)
MHGCDPRTGHALVLARGFPQATDMQPQLSTTDLQRRLDEFVARVRAETRVPGIALGVSAAGKRFYACAGTAAAETQPLTSDARFHLGCAGKLLLAIATLELERQGIVDTSAAIGEYLPDLRGSLHGDSVRISHLLSHTSGYRGTNILDGHTRNLTWHGLVRYLKTAERLFAPGSVFSYEHTEAVVLGEILQRATGRSADQLVGDGVLAALGIAGHPTARVDQLDAGRHRFDERANRFVALDAMAIPRFWQSAFSERTVALDELLTIAEAAIGRRADAAGRQIVSTHARRRLHGTVVRLPPTVGGPLRELLPVAFGLGAAQLRDGFHGGSGVSAGQCIGVRFDGRAEICVAVGLNAMVPYLRDFVLSTVCRELSGRAHADEPEPFRFDLADLEGTYAGPGNGSVDVRHENGRLLCTIGRERMPGRVSVELALDDDARPVLRSPLPHISLGFFREPGGDVALMLGLGAYRRGSTNRPFHKYSAPAASMS